MPKIPFFVQFSCYYRWCFGNIGVSIVAVNFLLIFDYGYCCFKFRICNLFLDRLCNDYESNPFVVILDVPHE